MWIQKHQLPEILSPKKECQRGLEEYIVNSHQGDKTEYSYNNKKTAHNRTTQSHIFINNPIYRIGRESDPGTTELSSRHENSPPNLNESALHTLYPMIDSGNVFISPKLWNQNWSYDRSNIPPYNTDPEALPALQNYQNNKRIYNATIENQENNRLLYDQYTREPMIYAESNSRLTTDEEPDGVHSHPPHTMRTEIFGFGGRPAYYGEYEETPAIPDGFLRGIIKTEEQNYGKKKRENFTKLTHSDMRDYGKYNNQISDGYGRMGDRTNIYPVGVYSADPKGNFRGVNNAYELHPEIPIGDNDGLGFHFDKVSHNMLNSSNNNFDSPKYRRRVSFTLPNEKSNFGADRVLLASSVVLISLAIIAIAAR